ncbi:MAG: hypothetical protein IJS63_03190 [Bacteroidaceae bacterium]|nr:hypothetical protein [Bacteroidaceae bacterium]
MNKEQFDIEDNEIRIVGQAAQEENKPKPGRRWWPWLVAALLLLAVGFAFWKTTTPKKPATSTYAAEPAIDEEEQVTYEADTETKAYTCVTCDSINDIALRIYTPVGGHIEMYVGRLPLDDRSIILAAQAADYRADNGQIAGAFVYKGELLSRGHPKYGFCAIIGDVLTMGMSRETALFERAVEQEGYFFRQFSLVHDGKHGESVPKGKAIRRALCYYQESIVIIETQGRESYHDFAQALMDLGVQEAIALVGNEQISTYEEEDAGRFIGDIETKEGVQETYIVWRK